MKITEELVYLTEEEYQLAAKALRASCLTPGFYFESWMKKLPGALTEGLSTQDFTKAINLVKANKYKIEE